MGRLFINATGKQKEEESENDENIIIIRSKICEVQAPLLSVMVSIIGYGFGDH